AGAGEDGWNASGDSGVSVAGDCADYAHAVRWEPRTDFGMALCEGEEGVETVSEHWRPWRGEDSDVLRRGHGLAARVERAAGAHARRVRARPLEELRRDVSLCSGSDRAGIAENRGGAG